MDILPEGHIDGLGKLEMVKARWEKGNGSPIWWFFGGGTAGFEPPISDAAVGGVWESYYARSPRKPRTPDAGRIAGTRVRTGALVDQIVERI